MGTCSIAYGPRRRALTPSTEEITMTPISQLLTTGRETTIAQRELARRRRESEDSESDAGRGDGAQEAPSESRRADAASARQNAPDPAAPRLGHDARRRSQRPRRQRRNAISGVKDRGGNCARVGRGHIATRGRQTRRRSTSHGAVRARKPGRDNTSTCGERAKEKTKRSMDARGARSRSYMRYVDEDWMARDGSGRKPACCSKPSFPTPRADRRVRACGFAQRRTVGNDIQVDEHDARSRPSTRYA